MNVEIPRDSDFIWLSVLLCMLTKPYSLHCFKNKNMLVWRVMNWQGRWSELRLTSVCFRAELIVSHALFPCSPHAQSEDRVWVACHHHPCYPCLCLPYLISICQSFCPYILHLGGLPPLLSRRSVWFRIWKISSANGRENEHSINIHGTTT